MRHPDLSASSLLLLTEYFPAFLLGNTAPDVQTVSGQSRENTHFYTLPIEADDVLPWDAIVSTHPSLASKQISIPEQAVFIAGYLCHLLVDWFWAGQIFEPFFGPRAAWKTFRERLYLHNVLRAYLDFRVLTSLNDATRSGLASVSPKGWLPFVEADHLNSWRDFLSDQLEPGAPIQTVEVFASRQGISAEKYYRLLNSEDELQHQVFDHFPCQHLVDFWQIVVQKSTNLLNEYLIEVGGVSNAYS